MWVHILLFLLPLLFLIGEKAGWMSPDFLRGKRKRLLFLVLLGGNFMGCLLTVIQNQNLFLEKGSYFEKRPYGEGIYEENLIVSSEDGRTCDIPLEVPEQEGTSKEPQDEEPVYDFRDEIIGEIIRLNEEIQDENRYYLPDTFEGRKLQWRRKEERTGTMISMLAFGAAVFLPIAMEREEKNKEQKKKNQMILDYPGMVMKLTLFIEAGMSVRRAFQRVALDYKKKKTVMGYRYAYEELLQSSYEMENGVSEGEAYMNFGQRCNEVHYKTLATLLVQNLKKGNQGLVQMLEQESVQAWEDRKRNARVLGETATTKLLVPMVLMLLVVVAVLLIPACLSFYG